MLLLLLYRAFPTYYCIYEAGLIQLIHLIYYLNLRTFLIHSLIKHFRFT